MLGRFSVWRHVVVVVAVLLGAGLAALGWVGSGSHGERIDATQVVVQPAGDDGLRIREVVDIDFGSNDRRGYQRRIYNDFGVPIEVTASSPDANDDVEVVPEPTGGDRTRIRVGDPDTTFTGQHRYVLSYTLPDAQLSTGLLQLDVIGDPTDPDQLPIERIEVIVAGMELSDTRCSAGSIGTAGGCELVQDGDVYRAVVSPLEAGEGITIRGFVDRTFEPDEVPIPPIPDRREDRGWLLAGLILALGAATAAAVYFRARHTGRNEVFAGGAAEAAYGELPAPLADGTTPAVRTVMVPDDQMDELATIEFVPPKGVEPWEGAVLLRERIDDSTVSAWFSGLVAKEGITLTKDGDGGKDLVMSWGPRRASLDPASAAHMTRVLGSSGELELGKYDKDFTETWSAVRKEQEERIRTSGWWKRGSPGAGCGARVPKAVFLVAVIWFFVGFGTVVAALLGAVQNFWLALVLLGLVVPFVAANVVYDLLRSARSATGSALALRTESFRRFLAASEGRHVEWAWTHGLLREYSAWAVALGAADAWDDALQRANVPEQVRADYSTPLLVYSMGSSFHSSHTPPSSSGGSGGGGGFSGGGSVGGGGGGGSSGSW